MDKIDNQDKEKKDGEREAPAHLDYLDRPTIYTGTRTIPKPPSRVMVWLRSIFGRLAGF